MRTRIRAGLLLSSSMLAVIAASDWSMAQTELPEVKVEAPKEEAPKPPRQASCRGQTGATARGGGGPAPRRGSEAGRDREARGRAKARCRTGSPRGGSTGCRTAPAFAGADRRASG